MKLEDVMSLSYMNQSLQSVKGSEVIRQGIEGGGRKKSLVA